MKTVFIDFDGTICPNKNGDSYPPPSAECLRVLNALKSSGHQIVIYSVRSNRDETKRADGHQKMIEYFMLHEIPYDAFHSSKPHFSVVIDDKGLGVPLDSYKNVDWSEVEKILQKKEYV